MSDGNGDENGSDLDTIRNVWLGLNSVLIIYALILFCYGKYFKHKDSLSYVIHII